MGEEIKQNVINVKKDYGAVGDGTTDDTTALQNAINAAVAANSAQKGGGVIPYNQPYLIR